MSAKFQFTEQAIRQIRTMRKQGSTLRQIAKAIGCSRTTLQQGSFNLGSLRRKFTKEEERRMVAMRKQGSTLQEIAIALDCSESSIRRRVHRLGSIPLLRATPLKPRRPVTSKTRRRVVALRKRDWTFEEIAKVVGLAYCTVRTIVVTGGKPPARNPYHNSEKTPEDKIVRIIALRRAGSSYAYIAEQTGVSAATAGRILKTNGFPGKILLVRLAGPVGSRVRGICRVRGCGVRHYGSGMCSSHDREYRQGRVGKNGKLLPSICSVCGGKFRRSPQRRRCDRCRRTYIRIQGTRNRNYRLGYIDKDGRILPFTCQQCGKKFRRGRKTRFCESCAAARPNMLRRQRRATIRQQHNRQIRKIA